MRNFRIKLDPVNEPPLQLPHPGLGKLGYKENLDLNRDWDDEEKRTKGGDISPKEFSTHQFVQERYIPFIDPVIAEFEERPILTRNTQELTSSEEVFGKPILECKEVKCIKLKGCHCFVAITVNDLVQDVYSLLQKKVRRRIKISN